VAISTPEAPGLALDSIQTNVTTLTVTYVGPTVIAVNYNTIQNNQPSTYGNFLALWQNSQVPWDNPPLKTQAIVTNTQQGSAVFSGLTVTSSPYIVGYSVGPVRTASQLYGNVCSTALVHASSGNPPASTFQSSLSMVTAGPTSLLVNYSMPTGCLPQTNGAWLGVWSGDSVSYQTAPDVGSVAIPINVNAGQAFFNGIALAQGQPYIVGLVMTGWSADPTKLVYKALAATLSFVGPSS
jgi:hypothetical protein